MESFTKRDVASLISAAVSVLFLIVLLIALWRSDEVFTWGALLKCAAAVVLTFGVVVTMRLALSPMINVGSAQALSASEADIALRSRIAPVVVMIGSAAIIVLALVLIYVFADARHNDPDVAKKFDTLLTGIFTAVLPVFATWVGTVLAFYFTNESYRVAAQTVRESAAGAIERLRSTPVKTAMIPRAQIVAHKLTAAGATLGAVALADIDAEFARPGANGQALSRLLVLDSTDKFVAVIHRSTWYELLAGGSKLTPPVTVAAGALAGLVTQTVPGSVPSQTYHQFITTAVAFVATDKMLADAKTVMEGVRGCQDVIVTEDGTPNTAVVGWIMNTDIARYSQA